MRLILVIFDGLVISGKTKPPQTVTLQVKIERGQKSTKIQGTVPDHVLAYPLRRNFPAHQKTVIFHLQCYHLQCFSFARLLGKVLEKQSGNDIGDDGKSTVFSQH